MVALPPPVVAFRGVDFRCILEMAHGMHHN
jgi:hypothetical protein